MPTQWIAETPARWDADKVRLIAEAPVGTFDSRYGKLKPGAIVPGEWWRAVDGGKTVGYGWLDVSFGDAEILLVVDPAARKKGVGVFILGKLEDEARLRGLNYLTNIVRPSHPQAKDVAAWLTKFGFKGSDDGRLMRAVRKN